MLVNKLLTIPILNKPIIIGIFRSVYGIRGWIKLSSFTEKHNNIFNYQPWFMKINNNWKQVKLINWRPHKKYFLINIKGVTDRNTAMQFINSSIFIDESQLPNLDNNEYYYLKDIYNCSVINLNGYKLGKVINVIETTAHIILVIKAMTKDSFNIKERLIPFIYKKIIKNIDLKTNIIKVDWDPKF